MEIEEETEVRAAVGHEFGGPLVIEITPMPVPATGHAVARMETSGLCHTDTHAVRGDWPVTPAMRLIPGHEVDPRIVFDLR